MSQYYPYDALWQYRQQTCLPGLWKICCVGQERPLRTVATSIIVWACVVALSSHAWVLGQNSSHRCPSLPIHAIEVPQFVIENFQKRSIFWSSGSKLHFLFLGFLVGVVRCCGKNMVRNMFPHVSVELPRQESRQNSLATKTWPWTCLFGGVCSLSLMSHPQLFLMFGKESTELKWLRITIQPVLRTMWYQANPELPTDLIKHCCGMLRGNKQLFVATQSSVVMRFLVCGGKISIDIVNPCWLGFFTTC